MILQYNSHLSALKDENLWFSLILKSTADYTVTADFQAAINWYEITLGIYVTLYRQKMMLLLCDLINPVALSEILEEFCIEKFRHITKAQVTVSISWILRHRKIKDFQCLMFRYCNSTIKYCVAIRALKT